MKSFLLCFLVIVLAPLCKCAEYISKTDLFIDVDRQYQLASFTNIVANSRYLDLVFIDSTHQEILVRTKAKNDTYFQPKGYQYSFEGDHTVSDMKIVGILPADFNHDKSMDLMVVFGKSGGLEYKLALLWNRNEKFSEPTHINETFSDIPFLLDYNGDAFVDFICSQDGSRYFWINQEIPIGTFSKQPLSEDESNGFEIDDTKGETLYAYGDLNGDCAADLFMITKLKNGSSIFEVYEAFGKELVKTKIPIPTFESDKYGAPLMQDMDRNGKLDIVIPGCSKISKSTNVCLESKIIVLYNSPCHTNTAEKCSVYRNNCKKFELYFEKFEFAKFEHNNSRYGFLNYDMSTSIFDSKFMLRAADVDSDGYIDLVGILKYGNSPESVIFTNVVDSSENVGGRSFNPTWKDDLLLNSDQTESYDPYALAPVDALGIGTIQFFLVGRKRNDPEHFSLSVLAPKDMLDMFWLKVSILCHNCDNSSSTIIGASAFYFTTGLKGDDQVGYMSQSSSLTSFSLQAPYMLFGLGQQANYIEYIKVAYRNTNISDSKSIDENQFDQLVPNAQVFVIPKTNMWKLVMMVVPGETMLQTLAVLGICCLVCIIIILVLHIKEKKEDEREKRKFNAKFNFDAM